MTASQRRREAKRASRKRRAASKTPTWVRDMRGGDVREAGYGNWVWLWSRRCRTGGAGEGTR
jgi:hypothetical protein